MLYIDTYIFVHMYIHVYVYMSICTRVYSCIILSHWNICLLIYLLSKDGPNTHSEYVLPHWFFLFASLYGSPRHLKPGTKDPCSCPTSKVPKYRGFRGSILDTVSIILGRYLIALSSQSTSNCSLRSSEPQKPWNTRSLG